MSGRVPALIRWRTMILASDLSSSARLIGLVLSTHMDTNGASCFPSIPTIAAESGKSERTVRYALDELERSGVIDRTRGGGRGHSSRYRIKGVTVAPFSAERVQSTTVKGAVVAPEDVQEDVKDLSLRADARDERKSARRRRAPDKPAKRKWTT